MNAEVWAAGIKWIFGAFLLLLIIWAVVVVKRAIVGKSEWVHWDRFLHRKT